MAACEPLTSRSIFSSCANCRVMQWSPDCAVPHVNGSRVMDGLALWQQWVAVNESRTHLLVGGDGVARPRGQTSVRERVLNSGVRFHCLVPESAAWPVHERYRHPAVALSLGAGRN